MPDFKLKDRVGTETTYTDKTFIDLPSGNGTVRFNYVSGTVNISSNGTHDVSGYANAAVSVQSGGSSSDFSVKVGDSVSEIYFNTGHSTSALDTALAGLTYATIDGMQACLLVDTNLGAQLLAVDLTSAVTGCYAVVANTDPLTVVYVTETITYGGTTYTAGWQSLTSLPLGASMTVTTINASFAAVKDTYFSKTSETFGASSGGSQPTLNAPTISLSGMTLTITNPSSNGGFVTGYKIYVDGSLYSTVTTTTVDLSNATNTSATVTVKCAGTNFTDSADSTSVTLRVPLTVHFYDGAAEMTGSPVTAYYGDTIAQAMSSGGISKSGYDLEGVYSDSAMTVSVATTTALTAGATFYTKWTETAALRFNYNAGSSSLSPWLNIAVNGTAVVDWGDGTTSTLTGTSTSTLKHVQHTYAAEGVKPVSVKTTGSLGISGQSASIGSTTIYRNLIMSGESGSNKNTNFSTKVGDVVISDGVEVLGSGALATAKALNNSLTVPSTVSSINKKFYPSYLTELHFVSSTPPTAYTNAFLDFSTSCTIYVPTGSLSAYTSASNYPDPNTYTYVEE